jgi:hypothetical protein
MAAYTPDEITETVESLVKGTVTTGVDSLGVRKTNAAFNEVQEAAAGVFLLYSSTPYYLLYLGSQRLMQRVSGVEATLTALLEMVKVLRRRVTKVQDLGALKNARVSLSELEVQTKAGTTSVKGSGAYQRVQASLDRFLAKNGSLVKSGGEIVPTPEEAKGAIPSLVTQLQEELEGVQELVGTLAEGISVYEGLSLPQTLMQAVFQKSRQKLELRLEELAGLDDKGRLAVIRSVVLDVLGVKAAVRTFGSFSTPGDLTIQGLGRPYADADRLANPAEVKATYYGPHILVPDPAPSSSTNILTLTVEGQAETFYLPPSYYARIEGQQVEPFLIDDSNDTFEVMVFTDAFQVSLTHGSRTAQEVADDITAGLSGSGFRGEVYYSPLLYEGEVEITGFTVTLPFGGFPADLIETGDEFVILSGSGDIGERRLVDGPPVGPDYNTFSYEGAALTAGPGQRIQVGKAKKKVRIAPSNVYGAFEDRLTLKLTCPDAVALQAGVTLGMYGQLYSRTSLTEAKVVADYIAQNSLRVNARVQFVPEFLNVPVHTDPINAGRVTAYWFYGTATLTAGYLITGTLKVSLAEDERSRIRVGDSLYLRSGAWLNLQGGVGGINEDGTLELVVGDVITAGEYTIEIGPPSSGCHRWDVLSGPNQGTYLTDKLETSLTVVMQTMFPFYRGGFTKPVYMRADIGHEFVVFMSRDQTVNSQITVSDPTQTFLNTPSKTARGTTPWFQLPEVPAGLEEGDQLQFFTVDTVTPSKALVIDTISRSDRVLGLEVAVASDVNWSFTPGEAPPFARLKKVRVIDFESYKAAMEAWNSFQARVFFLDLNRLLNPLLKNDQPADSQVGAVEGKLRELLGTLTLNGATITGAPPSKTLEFALNEYEVEPVPEVTTLINTYVQRGADRAVDLLLRGRFDTFFGLSQEESSYAGDFQAKLRSVMTSDLPVRKNNRLAALSSQHVATVDSPNYEIDTSDRDERPVPSAPVDGGL